MWILFDVQQLLRSFEEHEVNEEERSQQDGFHFDVEIQRKSDRKFVSVRKTFLKTTSPLFSDFANLFNKKSTN